MAEWTGPQAAGAARRRALITGGAGGLGFETARGLAQNGYAVVIADRNVEGGKAAVQRLRAETGAEVDFCALDLGDLAAIRTFAAGFDGPLDVLVNNAGLLPPLRRATTRDGFELKFGVSHLGHFALTAGLLPRLLRSPAPRVVSVSSIVQSSGRIDFDDLQAERDYLSSRSYAQTKLACLIFALELQRRSEAASAPLISVAAHPGISRTGIGDGRRSERRSSLTDWLEGVAFQIAMRGFGQAPAQGALPIIHAASADEVRGADFFGPDGFMQFRGRPTRVQPSAAARDPAIAKRLWEVSERLTGCDYAAAFASVQSATSRSTTVA
ncbi:oxidoreductase [Sinimarinibacterium flocculans]|uniref:NAD(P)-dependent dehydrogenase (Short-subunit alcohol dehydrogenase family) n=1 Tax=Sinimarinibacterium flocculans TaxID=985250 RepID=A0A318EIT0_9GAMM|nr:oxidoreductase [Sinimarinibacterium flocculans]PXV70516.1 NAD(P)-dependent dehydrogenase (short-subunit alcohol dehydrogenase family) [Sinimarinibacterium flocculans]